MSNDDKEKQEPTDETSNVTVRRNTKAQNDDDRDSKRQRLSSVAAHHFKPQNEVVLK